MDNYQELANAIILQAVKDYREALSAVRNNPKSVSANRDIYDCESFFMGGWFSFLTELNGETLIRKLKEEVSA